VRSRVGHALGRGQEQLAARRARQRVHLAALPGGQRRVDAHHRDALGHHLVDLILDQRDQRRHDDGQARQHQRRQLVQERLARAGGHHRDHVLAGEDVLDGLALTGAVVGDAEHLAPERQQGVGLTSARRGLGGAAAAGGGGGSAAFLLRDDRAGVGAAATGSGAGSGSGSARLRERGAAGLVALVGAALAALVGPAAPVLVRLLVAIDPGLRLGRLKPQMLEPRPTAAMAIPWSVEWLDALPGARRAIRRVARTQHERRAWIDLNTARAAG
jgi:hypothetical protein